MIEEGLCSTKMATGSSPWKEANTFVVVGDYTSETVGNSKLLRNPKVTLATNIKKKKKITRLSADNSKAI